MDPQGSRPEQFYRFTDADGKVHIVSSPDALPPAARGKTEVIVMNADVTRAENTVGGSGPSFALDGLSFGVGFGAALLLALVFRVLPQRWRWAPKLALLGGLVVVGGGLYFGYLHRMSGGTSSSPLASPSALIQDARNAVDQVKERRRAQEEELRAIQAEGK